MWLGNSHFLQVFQLAIACVIVWWLAALKLPEPSGKSRCLGFHLIVTRHRVIFACVLWLVLWLCWRFNDVVTRVAWGSRPRIAVFSQVCWLDDWCWLAVIFFAFVLAVSGLRIFQQVCFLFSNELLHANLPVTRLNRSQNAQRWIVKKVPSFTCISRKRMSSKTRCHLSVKQMFRTWMKTSSTALWVWLNLGKIRWHTNQYIKHKHKVQESRKKDILDLLVTIVATSQ